MKKSFPVEVPGKKAPRVIESIKNEVRKYLKRERRKTLPTGVDFWDFDCRVGQDSNSAATTHVAEINKAIDKVVSNTNSTSVYVEILAKPGHRSAKSPPPDAPSSSEPPEG